MNEQDAKKVVEALIFSSSEVFGVKLIAEILGHYRVDQVRVLIEGLNREYETTNRSFRIQRIGTGYQMRTLPLYKTWIVKTQPEKQPSRLTQSQLETLAIVAYRQPVTRADIEYLRGVDASNALRKLLEKRLLRIVGKDKGPGRAILYGTSREFLSLFNMSDLRDLPRPDELELDIPPESPAVEAQAV